MGKTMESDMEIGFYGVVQGFQQPRPPFGIKNYCALGCIYAAPDLCKPINPKPLNLKHSLEMPNPATCG